MTALPLLALLLAAEPVPSEQAWADKTCAPAYGESNVEYKQREADRVACLRRAMNRALDRVLLPLKAQRAASFREWMGVQADFNRFAAAACSAVEEAQWVSLEEGMAFGGTAAGDVERRCLEDAFAWRALFAESVAAADAAGLEARLAGRARAGVVTEETARAYLRAVRAASERAPEKAPPEDVGSVHLSRADLQQMADALEKLFAMPGPLARRQCTLLSSVQVVDCEKRLAAGFWRVLADLHE